MSTRALVTVKLEEVIVLHIAYLVNQYPKVSHSFIRREILAIERQGIEVHRIALRGWDADLMDAEDQAEQGRTEYVLRQGALNLIQALLRICVTAPQRFFSSLGLALKVGWRADRPLAIYLVYLAEACYVLPWLRERGVRHLHAHFGTNPATVAMLVHSLGGPPFSFTVHGPEEFDKPQLIGLREKIRRSAFVVAVSSHGRSQLYRWAEHDQWSKIKEVHCGLEPKFYSTAPVRIPDVPRLICVGRLCEQKGQLLLIEAAHRLARKGIAFELVLVGDGEMRPEVERSIRQYALDDRVWITGWISSDRVREEILAARGLVLPSFAEGLPVVIMEAMALRRPVLSTYVGGIPELVHHGETGWLFPAGSVDELSASMEALLAKPIHVLERMADTGYRLALERHSIDSETAKLAAYFREVSANQSAPA